MASNHSPSSSDTESLRQTQRKNFVTDTSTTSVWGCLAGNKNNARGSWRFYVFRTWVLTRQGSARLPHAFCSPPRSNHFYSCPALLQIHLPLYPTVGHGTVPSPAHRCTAMRQISEEGAIDSTTSIHSSSLGFHEELASPIWALLEVGSNKWHSLWLQSLAKCNLFCSMLLSSFKTFTGRTYLE
jgi:hypothetical protein